MEPFVITPDEDQRAELIHARNNRQRYAARAAERCAEIQRGLTELRAVSHRTIQYARHVVSLERLITDGAFASDYTDPVERARNAVQYPLTNYRISRTYKLDEIHRARRDRATYLKEVNDLSQQIAMHDCRPKQEIRIDEAALRRALEANDNVRAISVHYISDVKIKFSVLFENIIMREAENPEDYPAIPLYPMSFFFKVFSSGEVTVREEAGARYYCFGGERTHPHIMSDGDPCLGTFKAPLYDAFKQGHFDAALAIMTAFLSQYSIPDMAGSKATRFHPNHPDYNYIQGSLKRESLEESFRMTSELNLGTIWHEDEAFEADIASVTNARMALPRWEDNSESETCPHCGEDVDTDDEYELYDGRMYHGECFREHHATCDCCGENFHRDYMVFVEGRDELVCDTCENRHYGYCHDCGDASSSDLYHNSDLREGEDGNMRCQSHHQEHLESEENDDDD